MMRSPAFLFEKMILYIDESSDKNYFVVGGFTAKSDYIVNETHKQFKNHTKSFPMNEKDRRRVFTEFKSIYLDDSYPALKRDMLEHIVKSCFSIYYKSYKLNGNVIYQDKKEEIYINLLVSLINEIKGEVAVYFDSFKKKDFEDKIKNTISKLDNVILVDNKDSLNCKGIQFADNICSVIRRNMSSLDDNGYYRIIYNNIK